MKNFALHQSLLPKEIDVDRPKDIEGNWRECYNRIKDKVPSKPADET